MSTTKTLPSEHQPLVARVARQLVDAPPPMRSALLSDIEQYLASNGQDARHDRDAELFDAHMERLRRCGAPQRAVAELLEQREAVLAHASDVECTCGNVPFLPVIPPDYSTLHDQVQRVHTGDRSGYCYLDPATVTDVHATPGRPYFLFDVELGFRTREQTFGQADATIRESGRLPLTATELAALALHTSVYRHLMVGATGTRVTVPGTLDGGPVAGVTFCLFDRGRFTIGWNYPREWHPEAGTASAALRQQC